jgi:hypothetical protein
MASNSACTGDGHDRAAPLLTATLSYPRERTVVCTAVGEVDLTTGPRVRSNSRRQHR